MTADRTLLPAGVDLERDDSAGCYRVRWDDAGESPSAVVVGAVATVAETDPLDLEPLRESIDPDALDDLFSSTPGGLVREAGRVELSLADHRVEIEADGEVAVYPPA